MRRSYSCLLVYITQWVEPTLFRCLNNENVKNREITCSIPTGLEIITSQYKTWYPASPSPEGTAVKRHSMHSRFPGVPGLWITMPLHVMKTRLSIIYFRFQSGGHLFLIPQSRRNSIMKLTSKDNESGIYRPSFYCILKMNTGQYWNNTGISIFSLNMDTGTFRLSNTSM